MAMSKLFILESRQVFHYGKMCLKSMRVDENMEGYIVIWTKEGDVSKPEVGELIIVRNISTEEIEPEEGIVENTEWLNGKLRIQYC